MLGQAVGTALTGWVAFSGFLYGKSPSENRALPASTDKCLIIESMNQTTILPLSTSSSSVTDSVVERLAML